MAKVAIVTGGASGIGLGVARRFARDGYKVAIFDLQAAAVDAAVAELRDTGADIIGASVDVADRSQVDAGVERTRAELGPVTILVTSAGISRSVPFAAISLDDWNRTIAVNLTGTFHCAQAVIADMLDAGWGRIVTISSAAAQMGAPDRAHYAASKGGVIGLTKALAMEFAPRGITVNTIPPSIVDTPMARNMDALGGSPTVELVASMTPVRRAGTPEDIAGACAYLCSDEGSFITGQQINVNGGWYV